MDSQDAVSALSSVGITPVPVEPILGGWAYWTFDVGSRFIARFPRNDEIAEAAVRQIAILPALSNEVSYLVPIPSRIGVWLDRPFMVYSRIPGRGEGHQNVDRCPLHPRSWMQFFLLRCCDRPGDRGCWDARSRKRATFPAVW